MAVLGQQLYEALTVRHVGQVDPVGRNRCASRSDASPRSLEPGFIATADQGDGAGFGQSLRGGQTDAGGAAGHQHHLPGHVVTQPEADEQVGVEMAFPVVPDALRIVLEPRAADAAVPERRGGFAVVEAGRVIDELHDAFGQAEVSHHRVGQPAHGFQRCQAAAQAVRQKSQQRAIDAQAHAGRMCGMGEQVEHIADPLGRRVGQVKAAAVHAGQGGKAAR